MKLPAILGGKTSPIDKIKSDIQRLESQRDRIDQKLGDAQTEYGDAMAARLKILTEGDDSKAELMAQRRVDTARSTIEGLNAALAKVTGDIAEANRCLTEEQDQIARRAAADEIEADLREISTQLKPAIDAMRKLGAAFDRVSHLTFHGKSISEYLAIAASAVEAEAVVATSEIQQLATGIREGRRPIAQKPAPPVAEPKPAPTTRLWLLAAVAWTEGGMTQIRDVNSWADLRPDLAKKAVAIGAGVPAGDPKAGKNVGSYRQWHGYGLPALEHCKLLDDETAAIAQERNAETTQAARPKLVRSAPNDPRFEESEYGRQPHYTITTASGNAEPMGGEAA